MKKIVIKAYAKINLVLDVLKKRSDGYHEVKMIMQAISLHDVITLKVAKGIKLKTNNNLLPEDERNLAYKAGNLVMQKYDIPGTDIYIDKKIPIEAGLAGGSTDAAAVLIGLKKLFNLNFSEKEMLLTAAQLGSDVPFCLSGPTCLAQGRGEIIEKVADCPLFWIVLVKPDFGIKTAEVYKNLNLKLIKKHPNVERYINALKQVDKEYILNNLDNVLEYSTFALDKRVLSVKEKLYCLGAKNLLMSGSGPTIFAVFTCEAEAQAFAKKAKNLYNQVFITKTISSKIIKERVNLYE